MKNITNSLKYVRKKINYCHFPNPRVVDSFSEVPMRERRGKSELCHLRELQIRQDSIVDAQFAIKDEYQFYINTKL